MDSQKFQSLSLPITEPMLCQAPSFCVKSNLPTLGIDRGLMMALPTKLYSKLNEFEELNEKKFPHDRFLG
ncbi:MAG: hypothetical protein R2827_06620 [Bdellovibrionales bacterium]